MLTLFVADAQAAGFAVFGTFAQMVMTNYDSQWNKRLAQLLDEAQPEQILDLEINIQSNRCNSHSGQSPNTVNLLQVI